MRDVWEIPYLNPKARERTGYPTQKPVQLLLRIIQASSKKGDIILDPFVGSGTTVIAAELLGRRWIGIDANPDAIQICKTRLTGDLRKTVSISHYQPYKLSKFLKLLRHQQVEYIATVLDMNIVRRNSNLDGILKRSGSWNGVGVKYIEEGEVEQEIMTFANSAKKRGMDLGIVIIPRINTKEKKGLETIGLQGLTLRVFNFKDLHNTKIVKEILSK
jgi:site-specific DNA-methyltransferase (adenine-specific)